MPDATPVLHPLVQCAQCGSVVLGCRCPGPHAIREVPCCGVCTATGGEPVIDDTED
jgi:hypothetical protein